MPSTSNPSSPSPETSPQKNPSLEAGLAALKTKDYVTAIAHLEPIAQSQENQPSGLRAKMGLVAGYRGIGNINQAIALCSVLAESPNTQVKEWATRTLNSLGKPPSSKKNPKQNHSATPNRPSPAVPPPISPSFNSSDNRPLPPLETGFVPFDRSLQPSVPSVPPPSLPPVPPNTDLEGETPLGDNTGFIPLEPKDGFAKPPKLSKPKPIAPPPIPIRSNRLEPTPPEISPSSPTEVTHPSLPTTVESTVADEREAASGTNRPPLIEVETYELTWRQAGRAHKKWRPLKPLKLNRFWFEQIGTAIALLWATSVVLQFLMTATNTVLLQLYQLLKLPFLQPIQLLYRDPVPFLQCTFGILFVASPWLIDGVLKLFYGLQPLPMTTLFNYSQEANRVMRNLCQKRGIAVPTIKVLPTQAPAILSYGCLPRFARIVVSQGLLDRLAEDEIATLFARELGHIVHWDFAVMSLVILVLQIPYTLYWQVAEWGEKLPKFCQQRLPFTIPSFVLSGLQAIAVGVSSISYGVYWVLRWPVLWLSRRRVYYSDRFAAELTGNPNGLTRALVKSAIGIAQDVQQQKQTSTLLEGFEFLLPLGIQQAITLGSVAPRTPLEPVLQWDLSNPDRKWLVVNSTHPLIGERLQLVALYAQYWKLDAELDLPATISEPKQGWRSFLGIPLGVGIAVAIGVIATIFRVPSTSWENLRIVLGYLPVGFCLGLLLRTRPRLFLQGAPFLGILMGMGMAMVIWLIGGLFYITYIWQLDWLWGDRSLLIGCLFIGFSLGTLIRINYFFPDLKPSTLKEVSLAEILSNPDALPIDSQPIKLQGELIGRNGLNNLLGQDLLLQTAMGPIKLRPMSRFGPIGNLWPLSTHPKDFVGQSVTATGWLRRGATVEVDLETLRTPGGRVVYNDHPVWSTILAFATALWGTYAIFRGGI